MTEQIKRIQKMNEEKRLENLKEEYQELKEKYVIKIQKYYNLMKIYNDKTSAFYQDTLIKTKLFELERNIKEIKMKSIEIMKKFDV